MSVMLHIDINYYYIVMYYVTQISPVSAHIQIFEKLNKTREIEQSGPVAIVIETVKTLENPYGQFKFKLILQYAFDFIYFLLK
jgi:hypothetical protein